MVSGLMAEYAMGALSRPVSVLVETHLELSGSGGRWMRDVGTMAEALAPAAPHVLDSVEPVPFADRDAAFAAVMAAIEAGGAGTAASSRRLGASSRPHGRAIAATSQGAPLALERFIGMPIGEVPWKKVMPGIAEYRLPDVDGCEASLLRIEGGRAVPVHTHHGSELTVVLHGGFSDETGHYGVGDIAYADDEVNHKPVADAGEVCICFAVSDAPVHLTGPIGRLVNPFRR